MEIKLIISFSCVISTINFQRLKILVVTLFYFIVEYIFLRQFVKLLMVRYTYLLFISACNPCFSSAACSTSPLVSLARFGVEFQFLGAL